MGSEIAKRRFAEDDFLAFNESLEKETDHLKTWFKSKAFSNEGYSVGYELEFWLLEKDASPCPKNTWFLKHLNSPNYVPELARCNLEYNGPVSRIEDFGQTPLHDELDGNWQRSKKLAKDNDQDLAMVGILPTLNRNHLDMKNITPFERYYALNDQLMSHRARKNFHIDIQGEKDRLQFEQADVMAGSAATSLQIHMKVPYEKSVRAMNASMIASVPIAALAANSPFLLGQDLWSETRVPLFEQAVEPVVDQNHLARRTGFGNHYVDFSLFEVFTENLRDFPLLIPINLQNPVSDLRHLKLHNGTIWRWNRPIIGYESDGTPHLRIEHRVPAAGPTTADVAANISYFTALVRGLIERKEALEHELPFDVLKKAFYASAEKGLDAEIEWTGGKTLTVRELILDVLMPDVQRGLAEMSQGCIEKIALNEIIIPRVQSGQTGSQWQRNFIHKHGKDFHKMMQKYLELEAEGRPVHEWPNS